MKSAMIIHVEKHSLDASSRVANLLSFFIIESVVISYNISKHSAMSLLHCVMRLH